MLRRCDSVIIMEKKIKDHYGKKNENHYGIKMKIIMEKKIKKLLDNNKARCFGRLK